jgi:hypothetical protein
MEKIFWFAILTKSTILLVFTLALHLPSLPQVFMADRFPLFQDDVHINVLGHARDKKVNKKRIDEDWYLHVKIHFKLKN